MENDSNRKYITYSWTFSGQIFDVYDFGGNKTWSSASDKQILLLVWVCSQSKIADGQVMSIFFSENDILGFEVAMDDFVSG